MSLYDLERNGDVEELTRVVGESSNDRLRARAASLLGNFPDHDRRADAVDALVGAAQDDHDEVAAAAIDALEELGEDALEALLVDATDVDVGDGADWARAKAFVRALADDRPELRMAAANALGRLGEADAVPDLTDRLTDDDPRVRARAARACGQIGDPRATDDLADRLSDPVGDVRREAAEALGALGTRGALEALLPLYEDDDERVRRLAVHAFGSFENDRPVEPLVASLTDESPAVRRTAVYSLVELLANVPTERSHEIRQSVVDRLAAVEDRSVVEPLVEILEKSNQPAQRRNTAWLLGRVDADPEDDRLADALVDALGADDEMVRKFAATSLAELDPDGLEERLIGVVTDPDRPTEERAQAVFVLGKVGGEDARASLDDLLEDCEDERLRERLFSALSKLGGRR